MDPQVTAAILNTALPLVTTFVTCLMGLVFDQLRKRLKNENAVHALDRVERLATIAVADVNQTLLPMVREAMKDGKIDAQEARRLRDAATGKVTGMLGKQGAKDVKGLGVDIQKLLESVIEAKVNESRQGGTK